MTQEKFIPDMEKVKATSAKVQALCQRMDAEILVLDDIIAQLDEEIRQSPLYQYRLNKAKKLLNLSVSQK